MLVNLLDNALKYGGSGRVHARAETTGGVVRISVADAGPGIRLAHRERIFEKFFRADPQMTYAPSGDRARPLHLARARPPHGRQPHPQPDGLRRDVRARVARDITEPGATVVADRGPS